MEWQRESFVFYSVFGGCSSAIGSLLGKVSSPFEWLSVWKLPLVVIMIIFNTVGMLNYVKALNCSTYSLLATLCSAASNYCCTALFGWIILGEKLTFMWCLGTILIVLGIVIISHAQRMQDKDPRERLKTK